MIGMRRITVALLGIVILGLAAAPAEAGMGGVNVPQGIKSGPSFPPGDNIQPKTPKQKGVVQKKGADADQDGKSKSKPKN